jgi:transcriptional regulator with GAF, ATPase, and Fis domain
MRSYIRTLQATGGRIYGADGAARLLGLHPNTLGSRMNTHGLGGARDHRQGG